MNSKKSIRGVTCALAAVGAIALPMAGHAVPDLQIYLQGATYDAGTETWVLASADPIKLWVLGISPVLDVKLAIAYSDLLSPTFSLSSTTTGGFLNYADPSTPIAPAFSKTVTDGSSPIRGDGSALPQHGIYGSSTDWTEFVLGDFLLTDSEICDFITSAPDANLCNGKPGQINVYDFTVTGVPEGSVFHFDAYDHTIVGNDNLKYVFAPFSHDGETTSSSSSSSGGGASTSGPIPEPGTLSLFGAALLGAVFHLRQRRKFKL